MTKSYLYGALIVLILVGSFYWFQIRPSNIRLECTDISRIAGENQGWSKQEMEANYELCIHQDGLAN